MNKDTVRILNLSGYIGGLRSEKNESPLVSATIYTANSVGDGLEYRFPAGELSNAKYLKSDFLLEGNLLAVFQLSLQEGDSGPVFHMIFGLLNQCQARMRAPLDAVHQNQWRYPREDAWLKPMCGGEKVDLEKVDRLRITLLRKGPHPVKWHMTDLEVWESEPPLLTDPILPAGPLIDEMGQNTLRTWAEKSRSTDEVTRRLKSQFDSSQTKRWPEGFSFWGGWTARRFDATGFFRTHFDGKRWWLVDPDGFAFWSIGMDCVGINVECPVGHLAKAFAWLPERNSEFAAAYETGSDDLQQINFLAANLIRAFGPKDYYDNWAKISIALLKDMGFNTMGNWSDWKVARAAGFPYVRPLHFTPVRVRMVFRDMPDVFDPGFEEDAMEYAQQLAESAEDQAFIGYFLMNEPTWGFAQLTPAKGMLLNTPDCASRKRFGEWLREKYRTDGAFSAAWGVVSSIDEVSQGEWNIPLNDKAESDLEAFSSLMVEKLFKTLSEACRKVDPNHLNLGARYYTVPPEWALSGMHCFDVFSMNCYNERVPEDKVMEIVKLLKMPVMIGEWHFGALDVGLPGSGIGHVKDQKSRGDAYRFYVENAAFQSGCIGVHYFTLYDESALGRFDGENWNIGFMDVCNRPYEPLTEAARKSHERIYRVAHKQIPPFSEAPEYLEKLFL